VTEPVYYPITAIPFTHVTITDSFWTPRIETNRRVTVKYDFQKCEETGRISNFAKAGGLQDGDHEGIFFNDSDVFKVIEGASYTLMQTPDPELDAYLDNVIRLIAAAQEPDGYLYAARTIAERNNTPDRLPADREGSTRYSNLRVSHELYNIGHMYEGAVAHYLATGKRSLLDVAIKSADHVDSVFGPGKLRYVPGHQEIELGLAALYRVTGERRYLDLAKFFLDERGRADGHLLYGEYAQDHLPVTEQREAVGHAVRAVYMYAGMADVAALTGDRSYIDAIDTIWEDVVTKKLYVTGGIGARHEGEAFGDAYELPNATAYNETCAAIANLFWNLRLFQLHGHAKYFDVLERSLYNGYLSGIDFSGDRFFYVNPLEFDGSYRFNRDNSMTRMPWFNCSCCPTNVVRLFPALGGYVYAQRDTDVYVNLFVSSTGHLTVAGNEVTIRQETRYPWDGNVVMQIEPAQPLRFGLRVRIPGWAQGNPVPSSLYRYQGNDESSTPTFMVNGEPVEAEIVDGYALFERDWQPGDEVSVILPMPVRRVMADAQVAANRGMVAIERGPLVYCLEGIDNAGKALGRSLSDAATFNVEWQPELLQGINLIRAHQESTHQESTHQESTHQESEVLTFVPYYAWAHRGVGEMAVWLPCRS
jgi:DUF1680 family protein